MRKNQLEILVFMRSGWRFSLGVYACKTPQNHKLLWETPARCAERSQERFRGGGHRQRSGPLGAILEALTGLCHGAPVYLLAFFHPASRVAVAEAFLARRIGVVHLLAQDEKPAQCPPEAPDGTFWTWVRDVGFRHSVVSPPPPVSPGQQAAVTGQAQARSRRIPACWQDGRLCRPAAAIPRAAVATGGCATARARAPMPPSPSGSAGLARPS